MRLLRLGGLLAWLALWLAAPAWAEVAVPALTARVTDLTATLSGEQKSRLENDLAALEARSGAQLAVLLVPSTRPESVEQYALRVAEAWKLGRKGKDDGVLLLVAKADRKLRIEVGYGLEGDIPDAAAKRIIDETMAPRFQAGDFAGGVAAGVERLAALIEGRRADPGQSCPAPDADAAVPAPVAAPDAADAVPRPAADALELSDVPVWLLVMLVAVGSAVRWYLGPLFGGLLMGGAVGAGAWFFYGALEVALAAGLLAFVFFLVGILNWLELALSASSGGRGGHGGGFGGGGGSFGGGGASGRW